MIEISYINLFLTIFISFVVGMVYEYIASGYDYKTGKYKGENNE